MGLGFLDGIGLQVELFKDEADFGDFFVGDAGMQEFVPGLAVGWGQFPLPEEYRQMDAGASDLGRMVVERDRLQEAIVAEAIGDIDDFFHVLVWVSSELVDVAIG